MWFGVAQRSHWDQSGINLGSIRGQVGVLWQALGGRFRVNRAPIRRGSRGRFGNPLGVDPGRSGSIPDRSGADSGPPLGAGGQCWGPDRGRLGVTLGSPPQRRASWPRPSSGAPSSSSAAARGRRGTPRRAARRGPRGGTRHGAPWRETARWPTRKRALAPRSSASSRAPRVEGVRRRVIWSRGVSACRPCALHRPHATHTHTHACTRAHRHPEVKMWCLLSNIVFPCLCATSRKSRDSEGVLTEGGSRGGWRQKAHEFRAEQCRPTGPAISPSWPCRPPDQNRLGSTKVRSDPTLADFGSPKLGDAAAKFGFTSAQFGLGSANVES